MVRNAEATAKNAEASHTNSPGYCLQWSRERADIGSLFPDAATAWRNAFHRHKGDRNPPRGAMVYWTGGSKGYGHIAVSVGGGRIRSTDAGGSGQVATVDLGWPERAWGLPYAGWADNVNDVEIPGVGGGGDPLANYDTPEELSSAVLHGHTWAKSGQDEAENLQQHITDLRRQVNGINDKVDKILDRLGK
jgi:hypothetical protein